MFATKAAGVTSTKKARSDADLARDKFQGYEYTGPLRAFPLTPQKTMPADIPQPDYAQTGVATLEEKTRGSKIHVHTPEQVEGMRIACRLGREVLDLAGAMIKPGVTGDEIDEVVHAACLERKCYPSPLNYYKFPKSVCVSVNEVVCHGIPDMRPLETGDIVNLDVTVYVHHEGHGYHGDLNETYFVGDCDKDSRHLVRVAFDSLAAAIATVKPGALYREIGNTIVKVTIGLGRIVAFYYFSSTLYRNR
jgi:methionyl aminopeptidase